ncbi:hypothetical protein FPSE_05470 [Fusarium pseudograminearum CS3096]|uniref:Uncharacterized protein n=1 Tax=Fusarium pseudograminearum (strain CS3096) TaxID=1028729 RepID=K3VJ17_FUSPC|nr:hypothetical protein FPSE_05470 [Fusarium pseudograminearum CS3096]EKJ74324.1 hypothetical protein FPSE_05470 [Fusarium pseudograminearum CS3096]
MAAAYFAVTAVNSPHPIHDVEDAARECPDYAAAATLDQLTDSEDYVVFVCSALGEFSEKNTNNHVKLNKDTDPTCNVTLQYTLSKDDYACWDVMDTAIYDTIIQMAGGHEHESDIDWWDEEGHVWIKTKPAVDTIRIPGIVHKSSTCFMGPKRARPIIHHTIIPCQQGQEGREDVKAMGIQHATLWKFVHLLRKRVCGFDKYETAKIDGYDDINGQSVKDCMERKEIHEPIQVQLQGLSAIHEFDMDVMEQRLEGK